MNGLSDVLTDSSAKCYYTIECIDNMANNLNGEDISISVNVRLNKSEANSDQTEDVADVDTKSKTKTNVDNCSKEPSIEAIVDKCLSIHSLAKMKDRSKQMLIVVIMGVVATLLVALHTGPLRTRRPPNPTKLFDDETIPIIDYEFGELGELSVRALQNDVSFVMYYAPWDSDCIRMKKEFETVAKHYRHQIFFAAINCWWPEGQCRKYYNLKRYPVLLAHVRMAGEVEYKGPVVASYLIPFLDNLVDPIIPVQNEGDLLDLRAKHDAILIGFFDFNESPQPPGYKQFFSTAVKALASDPWRTVCYCVISSKRVAVKLSLAKPQTLTLLLWNSTEHYGIKAIKSATILSWVYSRVQQRSTLRWLTPSGIKSSALSDIVTKSPTFFLFTPRSFVLGISPYFDVLREVVMDYYNCDNSPLLRSIIHRSILRRHLLEEKLMELEEKCHELMDSVTDQEEIAAKKVISADTCCHSQVVRWKPSSKTSEKKCFCMACVHLSLAKCPANCQRFNCLATASRYLTDFDPNSANKSAEFCNQIKMSYQPKYSSHYRIDTTCSGIHPSANELDDKYFVSHLDGYSNSHTLDEKITKMVEDSELQHCHRLNLGLKYSELNFPDSSEGGQQWRANFTGLSCRTNRTLRFVALDSILFPYFAENIGIDVFNESHATVGIIVDSSTESYHVLANDLSESQTISKRSLVEFIKNFTRGSLPRFLKNKSGPVTSGSCLSNKNKSVVCVPELSSETFSPVVLNSRKDVVVMYYAQWCGFCSTIAHIYLEVARLFTDVDDIVFTRINGDANDLPWEYTVDRYPTIMFFPSKRKTESISFPSESQITSSTLVQFILKHSQPSVRLQISLQLCNRRCLLNNLQYSQSHRRSVLRSLNNRIHELTIVREKIRQIRGSSQKSAKRKTQIKELKDHLKHLIKTIRKLRLNLIKTSLLRALIIDKINNFDSNAQRLTSQSIKQFITIFDRNSSTDVKPKVVAKHKELPKKDNKTTNTKTKTTKKVSNKYSKGESTPKKDEL